MNRSKRLSVWSLLLAAVLPSCATMPPADQVPAVAPEVLRDDIAEMIVSAGALAEPALPAFSKADFIDRPPADLEGLLGRPALVRREGAGEFRRYDTQNCRLYAVVFPDEGGQPVVKNLSVGPLISGAVAPEFARCFVTGS